jgi:MinD-like ATPase involved in chromosome partitioning or flagellar assembly
MTVVALGSVKGSPGVTTVVLALASVWPAERGVLVAEADPDGGVLAVRRELGLEPGLVTLAAAVRRGSGATSPHTQSLGEGVRAIVAPPSAEQTRAALSVAGDRLWGALDAMPGDALVDCGRLTSTSPVLAITLQAAITLVVTRSRLEDVALLRERIPALRREGVDPHVVLCGDGPYHRDEVAATVEAPVIASIPHDRRTADALDSRSPRGVSPRSPLIRSARALSATLISRVATVSEAPA